MVETVIEPPLRPKLPAYGKALLQARRMGQHPREITVVYGDNWRGVKLPRLGVRPLQYVPGQMDWRVVAGVKVTLLDRAQALTEFDIEANRFGKFYTLIGELAAMDAYVVCAYPDGNEWRYQDAEQLAYACRNGRAWPRWWSDDLDARQRRAYLTYIDDMELTIRRKPGDATEK